MVNDQPGESYITYKPTPFGLRLARLRLDIKIMKINLNNNFWPSFGIIILLAIGAFILMQRCEHRVPKWDQPDRNILESKSKKDSIKIVIQKEIEQVTVYRDRWHKLIDTLVIPSVCDTVVSQIVTRCDTVIYADSLLIASQQAEIALSDTIISRQGQLILSQEDHITDLQKQVKKERNKKRFAWFTAALAAGVALAR